MPSVAAVSTQPKASAAVPLGATVSIATECVADCGVINAPPANSVNASPHNVDGQAESAMSAPNIASNTGSRKDIRRGHGRRLNATPKATELTDNSDSSTPPSVGCPASVAAAGTATSM